MASDDQAGGSDYRKIELTWSKGTDIPDENIGYEIQRRHPDSSWVTIHTSSTAITAYTDTSLLTATTYNYRVRTILNSTGQGKWGVQVSPFDSDQGTTLDPLVAASDGTFANRIKLTWKNIATIVENIRIERSEPGSTSVFEEIAILNKNATTYNDYEPIPGANYTYRVSFMDDNGNIFQSFDDLGHMKPNGIIKGKVVSPQGAGVLGVTVDVSYLNTPTGNQAPATGVNISNYSDTTDAGGNFEIRNIYYYDSASFVVTPTLTGHEFDPADLDVILDLNTPQQSNINFTDTTVFTVSGTINFPDPSTFGASGTDGGIENVKIFVDGQDLGIRTDAAGTWKFAIQDSGTYEFTPEYLHHSFSPASQSLLINDDLSNINFMDTQTDSIEVLVRGGCNSSITTPDDTPINVRITSTAGQGNFDLNLTTGNTGFATVVLPAMEFQLSVPNAALNSAVNPNALAQFADTTMILDLTVRDSAIASVTDSMLVITPTDTIVTADTTIIQPADTSYTITTDSQLVALQPEANFIYFRELEISVDFVAAGAEICSDNTIILQQQGLYGLAIEVKEVGTGCPVDTGSVRIYDYISDRDSAVIVLPIQNGFAFYEIEAGLPNTANGGANPYQKLLFVSAEAGTRKKTQNYWAVVEGTKSLQGSFTSRSPEIPRLDSP